MPRKVFRGYPYPPAFFLAAGGASVPFEIRWEIAAAQPAESVAGTGMRSER
jgi:hypothetical protein